MATVHAAQGQAQAKIPFRYGSRKRIQRVGSIPYQAGQAAPPMELPRVGFLAGILLTFQGTASGATGTTAKGPWSLISRLRLNLNLGAVSIYDTTGYGAYLLNLVNGDDLTRVKGYSATASNVNFSLYIPVSVNLADAFSTGLILLQDPQVRATLEVFWGQPTDAFTGATGASGTLDVHYVYWEVPDLSRVSAPPLVLHRVVEDVQPISQTGDNAYVVPRQGTLLQLVHVLELNGALSDAWDRYRLVLNRVDTLMDFTKAAAYLLDVVDGYRPMGNTATLPTGTVVLDLYRTMGLTNSGDLRDALDIEAVTTVESIVTVSPSATLGANNNFLRSIRRILQPIRV